MRLHRDTDGTLPAYAWPGGYPMFYLTKDDGVLCPDCANGKNGSGASETQDDPQWQVVAGDVHWEGQPLTCDHCHQEIESAYGDPEEK